MSSLFHSLKHSVKRGSKDDGTYSPNRTNGTNGTNRTSSPANTETPPEARTRISSSAAFGNEKSSSTDASNGHRQSISRGPLNPLKEIATKLHIRETNDSERDSQTLRDSDEISRTQQHKRDKHAEQQEKIQERQRKEKELVQLRKNEERAAEREDSEEMRQRYGAFPINDYASTAKNYGYINLLNLHRHQVGQEVTFRARIHNMRKMSAKLVFLVLRQQMATIQGVLQESDLVSKHFLYWVEHMPVESIVFVRGKIQKPKAKEGEVKGAMIHDKEILITEMHLVSKLTEHLPFTVNEAEVTKLEAEEEGSARHHISDRTRMTNRILDLRTTASQAIFRIQSGIGGLFRQYLDTQGFIEIHSPKLQGGATESGASVFKCDYFGRTAFLAQSPQLAKQMSVAADFGRVYEIGAVFRAENSNTHRHLTEYTGLDIEMQIDEHYHEARNIIDKTLKSIFEGIYKRYSRELEVIKRQFPHEDLVWLDKTPVLRFKDAVALLNETGWRDENGKEIPDDEDLGTRDEIQLGRVIKERYHTDYYIIDKFPASARPFYTMPDPEDPTYTNSFDIFVRGQEITSGGQRIHDADMLKKSMEKAKVDPDTMEEYMQGFYWAAPPHAGAGIGLERLCMLFLQLGDIRHASLYPRDPKSLPAKSVVKQLRHPEASTLHPPWEGQERVNKVDDLQPLEKLIANYGDASNTSWLEPKFTIWRDSDTGAAVGYAPHQGFALTIGDPLCHSNQYNKIMAAYLAFIKRETDLKPLWLLVGNQAENVLSERFDWRSLSCAAEQRLDLTQPLRAAHDSDIQRKIRHSEKEGVKIHVIDLGETLPSDFRKKIDKRVEDWLGERKDHQHVHLTDVHPWQDHAHRQYHYSTTKSGEIATLVILAQLAPQHGWQVKFSLDFPGAPSGAIEATVMHALTALKGSGAESATFGGGASNNLIPGQNLKGAKTKVLAKAYKTISDNLKLTQKSEFREKLGAQEDPVWICYPPRGLGPAGMKAILSFFED